MPHTVTLPNNDTAEFPDNWSQEQIQASIDKHLGIDRSTQPTINTNAPNQGGVSGDFRSGWDKTKDATRIATNDLLSLPGKANDLANKVVNAAPSEISGALMGGNIRGAANVAVGLGEIGRAITNIPNTAEEYLKHLRLLPEDHKDRMPHFETFGGENAVKELLGKSQPGDALLQNAIPLVGAGKLLSIPIKAGKKVIDNQLLGTDKNAALRDKFQIPILQQQAKTSAEEYEKAKSEHDIAVKNAKQGIRGADPDLLLNEMNAKKERAEQLARDAQGLEHQINNVPSTTDKTHIEDAAKATMARQEAEKGIDTAQAVHESTKQTVKDTENKISTLLNRGKEHDVEAASQIEAAQEERHSAITQKYKTVEKNLVGKEIPQDHAEAIKSKYAELNGIIKSGGMQSKEARQIGVDIDNLEKNKNMTANEAVGKLQSVKQYAREARQKAYEPGMNREERDEWKARYNELDDKVDELSKTLEDNIPAEDAVLLKEANKGWRNEVVPLQKNTIYQRIRHYGQMPDNIMKSLRGKNKGNVILRNIIQGDPEIVKNVLGQRYRTPAGKQEIHEAATSGDARTNSYIDKLPELKPLLDHREAVNQAVDVTKKHIEDATRAYEKARDFEKEAKQNATSTSNQHVQYDRERDKLQRKLTDHYDEVKALQKRALELEKQIPGLQKAAMRKNQTLAQKKAAMQALKDAKNEYKEASYRLPYVGNMMKKAVIKSLKTMKGF